MSAAGFSKRTEGCSASFGPGDPLKSSTEGNGREWADTRRSTAQEGGRSASREWDLGSLRAITCVSLWVLRCGGRIGLRVLRPGRRPVRIARLFANRDGRLGEPNPRMQRLFRALGESTGSGPPSRPPWVRPACPSRCRPRLHRSSCPGRHRFGPALTGTSRAARPVRDVHGRWSHKDFLKMRYFLYGLAPASSSSALTSSLSSRIQPSSRERYFPFCLTTS